ncbi:RNA ligase family protein [Tengunoibacter tsumagoiensis]|uniref:DNA ligase III n=1 Tax=Tengunoibacter tsumagoiensis TaxID=2014871 RepID=A0A401ZXJ9_9CHLR|nr:RNA ligase family protein [Tengunoibacter tsumagoiensis]GCE11562.1 DNA ligase III [Tengunoibacter tsumagoiensis]
MVSIYKYPRTPHIEGSGLQYGDDEQTILPMAALLNRHLVIEEKMDGANCAISFSDDGTLLLQSRGHYLSGGPREAQFSLFKTWAYSYMLPLYEVLGERYILYGEWLYAKHTIFYTELPHYFMEFDLYDKEHDRFLSTVRRRELLALLPFIVSVKVLYEGQIESCEALLKLVGPSHFIGSDHLEILEQICQQKGLAIQQILNETNTSLLMEGLYLKIEDDDAVQERYKYVRKSFLQSILSSESHWMERPIIPNQLSRDASLF